MDGFCEQVVKRKRKAKDNILAVVYIVMALLIPAVCISLAYVITAYFIYIGFFLLLALVPLALLLINYQKVEYEYSVVDNTLNVDKIIAKRRRKKIVRLRIDEIKEMVKFNEKYTGKKINKYYIAVDDVNDDDVYAFTYYNEARGNLAVVMKPNNTILEGMRPKLNRSIQIQVVKLLRNVK